MFVFRKYLILISLLCANCQSSYSFWWGSDSETETEAPIVKPTMRQLPVSYIRAFAYQPVAFPTPLGPITTYHVSKNANQQNGHQISARTPNLIQQFLQQQQHQQQSRNVNSLYSINAQQEYTSTTVTQPPTTTPVPVTTTTTTTPSPPSQPQERQYYPYSSNPYVNHYSQIAQHQFPQYNQYGQYVNPHSHLTANRQSAFQYYTVDPSTYQFIPTNVGHYNGGLQFVPCMCPIGVNVLNTDSSDRTTNQQSVTQSIPTQIVQQQQTISQTQSTSVPTSHVVLPESNNILSQHVPSSQQTTPTQVAAEETV